MSKYIESAVRGYTQQRFQYAAGYCQGLIGNGKTMGTLAAGVNISGL
jgi:hypothetical protein